MSCVLPGHIMSRNFDQLYNFEARFECMPQNDDPAVVPDGAQRKLHLVESVPSATIVAHPTKVGSARAALSAHADRMNRTARCVLSDPML